MSLATRCPACGTIFRVVQDQLRVSEGWVRCGRCSEVFNGQAALVDLAQWQAGETDGAQDPTPPAPSPTPVPTAAPLPPAEPDVAATVPADDLPAPAAEAATVPAGRQEPAFDDGLQPPPDEALLSPDPPQPDPAATASPRFLREAEKVQRWQRPAVRRTLAALVLLGTVLLGLQVAVEYRDLIAARWAQARPPLETMCRWTGCRIEPARWIDAIVVDGSGLVRVEGTSTYRLSVQLRNRAAMELAIPSLDLILNDAQGRVISRRTLPPGDLGAASPVLPALGELGLQASLAVTERAVAGYTIEIFYP